jgi:hypothetical protein
MCWQRSKPLQAAPSAGIGLEGETLARRLEKGSLPLAQVLNYGEQIAYALEKGPSKRCCASGPKTQQHHAHPERCEGPGFRSCETRGTPGEQRYAYRRDANQSCDRGRDKPMAHKKRRVS